MKKIEPKGRLHYTTFLSDRGGVGYIRSILPNTIIGSGRYKNMSFEPTMLTNFVADPNFYKSQAFVKFQRSATEEQLKMFSMFSKKMRKQTSTPMIYEIDDLVVECEGEFIPDGNFASSYYKRNKPYIEQMLAMVDGITVSTPYLKKQYSKYNKNISLVRNRLAKCLWGEVRECNPVIKSDKPRILYPGSQNHFGIEGRTGEGGDFGKELLDYIGDTADKYEWIFVGGIPSELKDNNKIIHYSWLSYMEYPIFLKSLDVDLAIAPLEINEFNKSKSNLKALEFTVCGFPAVYTDIEPYRNVSCKAKTETDFINKIEELLTSEDKRYSIGKKDRETLKNNLFIEGNRKKGINEHLRLFDQELK